MSEGLFFYTKLLTVRQCLLCPSFEIIFYIILFLFVFRFPERIFLFLFVPIAMSNSPVPTVMYELRVL